MLQGRTALRHDSSHAQGLAWHEPQQRLGLCTAWLLNGDNICCPLPATKRTRSPESANVLHPGERTETMAADVDWAITPSATNTINTSRRQ